MDSVVNEPASSMTYNIDCPTRLDFQATSPCELACSQLRECKMCPRHLISMITYVVSIACFSLAHADDGHGPMTSSGGKAKSPHESLLLEL